MMVWKPWTRIAAFAIAGAALAGCSNTMNGASKDANDNAAVVNSAAQDTAASAKQTADEAAASAKQTTREAGAQVSAATDAAAGKVVIAADQASAAVKKVPKEVDAALLVTPQVKTAIVRDVLLNDVRNQINVDTAEGLVHLKGHVVNQRMKDRASEVAADALRKDYAAYAISNELTVSPDKD
ncbi:MAG: hypothetical protein JWQ02_861 [Capsulimonas sp.]|jgi:predicted small secreted protein|nr:hypothetical protein [Capsulimonas sp.]